MSAFVAWLGAVMAACGVVFPHLRGAALGGLILSASALALARRAKPLRASTVLPVVLAAVYAIAVRCPREFRADSVSYFSYLRSVVYDRDLSFANEWTDFGYSPDTPTETGYQPNAQSVGPAILWSPFYLAAHLAVRAASLVVDSNRYLADGYSAPYLGAVAVGTLTIGVLGAAALARVLSRYFGWPVAVVAVAGTIVTSPVLYYLFVVPTMAHGVSFGIGGLFVWSWERARREPSLSSWLTLGGLLGLLTLSRWQAAVYVIWVGALAAHDLVARRTKSVWLLAAAGVALSTFVPQVLAWKVLFGRFFLLPQGTGYLTPTSSYFFHALFSANHGLFTWTPALILGLVGLFVGLRRDLLFFGGALAVFVATAWVNGSVPPWDVDGGDAFGARRFDIAVPLLALGMGSALGLSNRILSRVPLLAPAGLLVVFALWNVGFIKLFRARKYEEMAPLARVAGDQVQQLQAGVKTAAERLFGAAGAAWVYRFFSAEYFYTIFNRSGTIDLWQADERYLLDGWGSRSRRIARPPFRRALYPEACVRIPLEEPFDLRVEVQARLPEHLSQQTLSLAANGRIAGTAELASDWSSAFFLVPEALLMPGENRLCLGFSKAPPPHLEEPVAAEVTRIQLP